MISYLKFQRYWQVGPRQFPEPGLRVLHPPQHLCQILHTQWNNVRHLFICTDHATMDDSSTSLKKILCIKLYYKKQEQLHL